MMASICMTAAPVSSSIRLATRFHSSGIILGPEDQSGPIRFYHYFAKETIRGSAIRFLAFR